MKKETSKKSKGTFELKTGLARMLKGGVIMDVTNAEQAKIAEEAGAVAVMALERVPSDIRRDGGVARMSDPQMIQEIMAAVSIPVMAKVRIGHFAEAQILESLGVDYIDESEALRRIAEGACMIRTKGEAGTGNVVEAVRHMRTMNEEIAKLQKMKESELKKWSAEERVPLELTKETKALKRLAVVNFAAGGIATPADASLMMQLGCDGIFVGSGIFKSADPAARARAIVEATLYFKDSKILAE